MSDKESFKQMMGDYSTKKKPIDEQSIPEQYSDKVWTQSGPIDRFEKKKEESFETFAKQKMREAMEAINKNKGVQTSILKNWYKQ